MAKTEKYGNPNKEATEPIKIIKPDEPIVDQEQKVNLNSTENVSTRQIGFGIKDPEQEKLND